MTEQQCGVNSLVGIYLDSLHILVLHWNTAQWFFLSTPEGFKINWAVHIPCPKAIQTRELSGHYYCLSCMCVLRHHRLFAALWSVAHQASLSMGFSRQEYWSGCHFLLQGIFPTQGSNPQPLPHLLHCRWILPCWAIGEAPSSPLLSVTSTAGQGWLSLNYSCHLPEPQSSALCSPESASACPDNLVSIKCFWHYPSGSFRHWALIVNHFYPMQVFSLPPTALRTQHSLCLVESK